MKRADRTYLLSISDRRTAGYVNLKAGGNGTITMKLLDITPAIAFYLDSYSHGSMVKAGRALHRHGCVPDNTGGLCRRERGAI